MVSKAIKISLPFSASMTVFCGELSEDIYRTNTPLSLDLLFNWFLHSLERISFFHIFWLSLAEDWSIPHFTHLSPGIFLGFLWIKPCIIPWKFNFCETNPNLVGGVILNCNLKQLSKITAKKGKISGSISCWFSSIILSKKAAEGVFWRYLWICWTYLLQKFPGNSWPPGRGCGKKGKARAGLFFLGLQSFLFSLRSTPVPGSLPWSWGRDETWTG